MRFESPTFRVGSYSLRATAPPFEAVVESLTVADARPVSLQLRLSAVARRTGQCHRGDELSRRRPPRPGRRSPATRCAAPRYAFSSRGLQDAIATTPGWATEDNGLLHARGVDDGFLYVVDGVPMYERMDSLHGVAPDPEMVGFGERAGRGTCRPSSDFKSGGVIEVQNIEPEERCVARQRPKRCIGSDATGQGSSVFGGPAECVHLAYGRAIRAAVSDRFLDPVHPDNLHNSGAARECDRQSSAGRCRQPSTLSVVGGFGRSSFDVPHNEDQEEEGQDQRQRNRADLADGLVAARVVERNGHRRSPAIIVQGRPR